ncbi:hypothetical protein B9Q01_04695 [Candidatus Marsarchaeota G1 archaeon OSP_D]|jgi:alkanesulfonate monooxygenase SsuD/methylene tetrahydromethanopterin reductase-like flavin-dependent oxidoreductase (luciferase family)|uniref:Luciferase-like domain-containing protein n=2 Tax=Candidatus Marsarchaeota group 1 TaxID=2203770 RepID=A0A2R6AAQ4_9ARCH|nr:MAG: hypothetical protein B9Q01_04695 [Candidatus Marsarchaeota G1 archaeon OSP_D]PSN88238.1 MAG: hypothetical protein B9Q00_06345 [Candidatus Marsarchaeota G1 archaeon OSP_C]
MLEKSAIMLEPQEGMSAKQVVEWAKIAENAGFGRIFRSDHLLPTSGRRGIPSPECWTTLGLVAATTQRIEFGPLVSPVGFRNPALLANMACTLHSFSNGRLVLGVGAGWYRDEYLAYGFHFPSTKTRLEQLDEALRIIRPLIKGERVDFDGKHFSAHTQVLPKPEKGVHLIVGGSNPQVVELAAQHCDEWNFFAMNIEKFKELKRVFLSKAKSDAVISRMGPFLIAEDEQALKQKLARFSQRFRASSIENAKEELKKRGVLLGSVDEFAKQIEEWTAQGVERFMFQILEPQDKSVVGLLCSALKQIA